MRFVCAQAAQQKASPIANFPATTRGGSTRSQAAVSRKATPHAVTYLNWPRTRSLSLVRPPTVAAMAAPAAIAASAAGTQPRSVLLSAAAARVCGTAPSDSPIQATGTRIDSVGSPKIVRIPVVMEARWRDTDCGRSLSPASSTAATQKEAALRPKAGPAAVTIDTADPGAH